MLPISHSKDDSNSYVPEPFRTLVDADGRTTYERVPRRANGASSAPAIIPEPRATSGRALQREETLIAPQQALGPQRAPVLQQAPVPQQSPVTVRRMPAALAGRDEDAMAISQPTTPIPPLRITDDRAVAQFMRSAAADDFVAETRAAITARIAAAARDEDPFSLPVDALPPPPYTEGAGPSNNAAAPSNPQDIARRRDERRARTNQITARRTAAAAASSSRRTSTGGSTSRRAAASTSEQRVEYIIVDD